MKSGERTTCNCGVAIVGARSMVMPGRPGGGGVTNEVVFPVDLRPDPEKGNVLLQQIDGELRAIVFAVTTPAVIELREHGVQLRRLHLACERQAPTRPTEGTT